MQITSIKATTLPDLWFQAVYNILDRGILKKIDKGSFQGQKRLELSYFIGHITKPGAFPRIPEMPEGSNIPAPVSPEYEQKYIMDFMTSVNKELGEDYSYGERINGSSFSHGREFVGGQREYLTLKYKLYGYNCNQNIIQVSKISDLSLDDPPCLRHIDTKIEDGKLNFVVYFRSWDAWGGLPANLSAIQTLKENMASDIGVEDGEMIVESKGLHLYDHCIPLAKTRCNK